MKMLAQNPGGGTISAQEFATQLYENFQITLTRSTFHKNQVEVEVEVYGPQKKLQKKVKKEKLH
eukprot:COSAG01_NODE_2518_length_7524_cov_2.305724_12_plen_64_part_00